MFNNKINLKYCSDSKKNDQWIYLFINEKRYIGEIKDNIQ